MGVPPSLRPTSVRNNKLRVTYILGPSEGRVSKAWLLYWKERGMNESFEVPWESHRLVVLTPQVLLVELGGQASPWMEMRDSSAANNSTSLCKSILCTIEKLI